MSSRIRTFIAAAAMAAAASSMPGSAGHVECHSTLELTVGTGEAGSQTLYYDDRSEDGTMPGFMGHTGTYIYAESNNRDGLQRGGASALFPDLSAEKCTAYKGVPDTMIF